MTNTNIIWASCYGNEVTRYDAKTKMARSVSPWLHTLDSEPNKAKYRCHWTPPLAIDPFDHNARLLRLPGDLPHHQRRSSLDGDQPGSFARAIRSTSSLPAESWAITWASSTAKWSSPSRRPRSRRAWSGPAPTTAKSGTRATAGADATLDRRHQEHPRPAAHGSDLEDRAVAFRRGNGLHLRRFPPDGQPRSVGLSRPPISARPGPKSAATCPRTAR